MVESSILTASRILKAVGNCISFYLDIIHISCSMSMGFLVEETSAIVWRGLMVGRAAKPLPL